MNRLPATLFHSRFSRDTNGFVAAEFGLALPLLALMLLGFVELDRYAWATRQLETTASSIAQMMTQTQPGEPVTNGDVKFARDSVMVLFPRVLQDSARLGHSWSNDISIGISSVNFKELTPGCVGPACKYEATVAWSGGNARRPCKTPLAAAANTDAPNPKSLPADAFGPNSIVVVDLTYTYKPLFLDKIFSGVTLKRSAYLQPRYVDKLPYATPGGDSLVTTCS